MSDIHFESSSESGRSCPNGGMANDKLYYIPLIVDVLKTRKIDSSHWHDYTQVWYVLSGEMVQTVDGKRILQKPGSCVVVLPYTTHSIDTSESKDDVYILSLSFPDDFLNSRGHEFFSYFNRRARFDKRVIPNFRELSGASRELADDISRELIAEFAKHADMSFDKLAELLCKFFNLLCNEVSDNTGFVCTKERANAVTKVVRYMNANVKEKLTLDDLCGVAMMSRRMFSENFKAVTGLTPMRYLLSLRVSRACFLLTYSDITTDDVAYESGFNNKVRLAHVFAENLGVTPTEYRRASRPKAIPADEEYRKKWQWLSELHPNIDNPMLENCKNTRKRKRN